MYKTYKIDIVVENLHQKHIPGWTLSIFIVNEIAFLSNQIVLVILSKVLSDALDNLNAMRSAEGEKLKADILSRNDTIIGIVSEIETRAPLVKEDYAKRLKARVEELLGTTPYDEARLLQEVAIFADKSNIDEELTRLKSHTVQFKDIVKQQTSGKKLDFLVQEFNREANTICSKSNDLVITDCGLKLKCEIEKIREQIQNIE